MHRVDVISRTVWIIIRVSGDTENLFPCMCSQIRVGESESLRLSGGGGVEVTDYFLPCSGR